VYASLTPEKKKRSYLHPLCRKTAELAASSRKGRRPRGEKEKRRDEAKIAQELCGK